MFSTISNQLNSFRESAVNMGHSIGRGINGISEMFTGKINQTPPTEADIAFLKDRFTICKYNIDEPALHNLLFNLFRDGIKTPNDCKIDTVYISAYSHSSANNFFGPEGWTGEGTPTHSNYLCVIVPPEFQYEAAKRRLTSKNYYVIHPQNFTTDRSLDVDFVKIIRQGFSE